MGVLAIIAVTVYTISLLYITVYCVLQFNLLYNYKKDNPQPGDAEAEAILEEAAVGSRKLNSRKLVAAGDLGNDLGDNRKRPRRR